MNFKIFITLTKSIIRSSIGRFIILICICALGAGFYCGMNQVPLNMRTSLDQMLNNNNVYDYKIVSDNGINSDDTKQLDGTPSKQYDTVAQYNGDKHVVRFQQYLNADINNLEIKEGHLPQNDNEGVTIQSQLENAALSIGDTIQQSGKEIKIVGIVNSAEYFNYANVGYTRIADGLLESVVFIPEGAFSPLIPYYCVYCKGTVQNIDEKYSVYYREENDSIDCYTADVERIESLAKIFPLIFYLIAIVVTITVVSRKVAEDRRALGISLSLGIRRHVLLLQYLSFTILAAIIGSAIGVALFSVLLPKVFMTVYGSIYNVSLSGIQFSPEIIAITVSITILVVAITTIVCVLKTIYSHPNKLLMPKSQKSAKRTFIAKSRMWQKIPSTWQATIRATLVYPMRFITSVINIACCIILFMCSLNLYYSSTGMINKQVDNVTFDNYAIYLNTEKHNVVEGILHTDPNVKSYSYVDNFVVGTKNSNDENMYFTGIWTPNYDEFHSLRAMKNIENSQQITPSDEGVVITQRLSEVTNINAGDYISFSTNDKDYKQIKVDGVVENYVYNYAYFGAKAAEAIKDAEPTINAIYVDTKNVDSLNDKMKNLDEVLIGETLDSTYAYFKQLISSTTSIAIVLIIITCIMSFTVLYSLTTIAVCERSRELSVLSMLGFKNKTVSLYVHRDTVFHLLIGLPLGVLAGSQLCVIVLKSIEGQSIMYDRAINPSMVACSITLLLIFILISVVILALQTNRIKLTGDTKGQD